MKLSTDPVVGDLICYNFYEDDSELGIIAKVLNPIEHWSKGLGYPKYVFQVITNSGALKVWDFFNLEGEINELEIISKA